VSPHSTFPHPELRGRSRQLALFSTGFAPFPAGYRTRFLRPEQWQIASPAVEQAIRALAADGVAGSQMAPLLSVLCRFLADSGWDRRSPIDWDVLLTERNIDQVCSAWTTDLSVASVRSYRGGLRRIASAVSVSGPHASPRPMWVPTRVGWWWQRRDCGPFIALAAAWEHTGGAMHTMVFNGMSGQLRAAGAELIAEQVSAVCPPGVGVTGTVDVDPSVVQMLWAAADVDWEVVLPDTTITTTTGGAPRGRTRSGARRMAELRRQAREGTPPTHLATPAPLPEEVAAAIAAYVPKKLPAGVWAQVADAARAAMMAFAPNTPRWVSTHGGYVVRFCVWVHAQSGQPDQLLDTAALLAPGLVDRYVATGLDAPDSTVATIRWVLRRAIRQLSDAPHPQGLTHRQVQPPYTAAECAALVRLARAQPTTAKRRALSAAVALGLGAGLDGRDQRLITRADITTIDIDGAPGLCVQVRGTRARTVVVRRHYVPLLAEACRLHGEEGRAPDELLHGREPDRSSTVAAVGSFAVTATGQGVDISAARMRTTWLLAIMCSPLPLAALLAAAGLTTARTLTELLPYCPPADPDDVARILAATDTPTQGVRQ
jgi:hypothetical protein